MIEAIALTKRYGSLAAIEGVSFEIRPGEVVGLLGPNGAGKTTTLRILTGFMPPTSGAVKINGFDLLKNPLKAKRQIGYLPENTQLYPELTVEESLLFAAGLQSVDDPKKEALAIMEKVSLLKAKNKLVGNLSKGFRQRVGIAQALIHHPRVLILDEPMIGLDPKQILEIRELIQDLKGEQIILFSSHIMQEVSAVCDRVIIINRGRIVADGKIGDLTQSLQKKSFLVTLRSSEPGLREKIENLEYVEKVEEYASSLEELFLKLTE